MTSRHICVKQYCFNGFSAIWLLIPSDGLQNVFIETSYLLIDYPPYKKVFFNFKYDLLILNLNM